MEATSCPARLQLLTSKLTILGSRSSQSPREIGREEVLSSNQVQFPEEKSEGVAFITRAVDSIVLNGIEPLTSSLPKH